MSSPETINFLDMIKLKFEFTAQEMSNPKRIQEMTGVKFTSGYDHESYQNFRNVIRRVSRKIIDNDMDLNDKLNVVGLQPFPEPPLMRFDVAPGAKQVAFYRSDLDIHPLLFTDQQEMQVVAYILTVWQNAWMQQVDPEAMVRQRLHEQGITSWQEFEDNKTRMELMNNPFPAPV